MRTPLRKLEAQKSPKNNSILDKIVGKSKIWNNQKFWKVHNNDGLVIIFREMWDLFNVNDAKGLNVFEVENGIVDMTQTGDSFDR